MNDEIFGELLAGSTMPSMSVRQPPYRNADAWRDKNIFEMARSSCTK